MKCKVWKPCGDRIDNTNFDFQFEDILAICLCKQSSTVLLTNIHNLILKVCPKFQVLSSYFSEVNELFNECWKKIVQREIISTPIHIQSYNKYQWKVCV